MYKHFLMKQYYVLLWQYDTIKLLLYVMRETKEGNNYYVATQKDMIIISNKKKGIGIHCYVLHKNTEINIMYRVLHFQWFSQVWPSKIYK